MIRRIAREVGAHSFPLEREPAPQGLVPVAEPSRAEMSGGRRRDAQAADGHLLPPVQLDDVARAPAANVRAESEGHDPGGARMRLRDSLYRWLVEVIVVRV